MTKRTVRAGRLVLLVLLAGAATLLVGVAVISRQAASSEGPLVSGSTTEIAAPMAQGQVLTWGSDLPLNNTSSDIVIESVEPVDPQGVDILGLSMIQPDVTGGIVGVYEYPPSGVTMLPIEGAVLTPAGGSSPALQVLTGVRLASGSPGGSIKGLRVRYAWEGREYEYVVPQTLTVTPPSP